MAKKPNIVYVIPDEFRRRAMAFRGEDPVITPNLDAFSKQALEFENAVSTYPVCSPYRAMLFTGKYPYSNGVIGNCNTTTAQFDVFLRKSDVCLPDVLSANGYDCGYIGKWHLDKPNPDDEQYLEPRRHDGKIWDAFTPKERRHGFNFWYSYGCNDKHFTPHYWFNDDKVSDERKINEWSPQHETDVAVRYITNTEGLRDETKPFALFVAYNPPHMPFDKVPERYKQLYAGKTERELLTCPNAWLDDVAPELPAEMRANAESLRRTARESVADYFAAVTGIDEQFGRILKALTDKGLDDDTIVIFTSDHGEMMGSHSIMYKGLWYDESYKVPFLMRYPGKLATGKNDVFLNPPDIMPTLLEMVGLSDETPGVEGRSVVGGMASGEIGEGYFFNNSVDARGVTDGKYFLVTVRNPYGEERHILYDLSKDPLQTKNVASDNPDIVAYMRERLGDWLNRTGDVWLRD